MARGLTFAMMFGGLAAACSLVADLGPPKTFESLGPSDGGANGSDVSNSGRGLSNDTGPDEPSAEGVDDSSSTAEVAPGGDTSDEGAVDTVQATLVAVGPTQACAIVTAGPGSAVNGAVRCWGSNGAGELGSDPASLTSSSTPLPVHGFAAPVGRLTLAPGYACAVTMDDYLYCWGRVPIDPRVLREPSAGPYQPSLMDLGSTKLEVSTASVGTGGGCASLLDMSLLCWGAFAPASMLEAGVVVLDGGVTLVDAFASVVTGRAHACGIVTANGVPDVKCWGANDRGQSGVPLATRVNDPTPVGLAAIAGVTQVAAGGDNTCALLDNGSVYCWGANDHGQLGDAADAGGAGSSVPTRVNLPSSATEIAVGDTHACALMNGDTVRCWGDDSSAQLGSGSARVSVHATPTTVQRLSASGAPVPLAAVLHVAAGGRTTCTIVLGSPYVWCWGANDSGQAGQPIASAPTVSYATQLPW